MHRPSFGEMTTFLKMEDFNFHSVTSKIQNLSETKEIYSNKGNQNYSLEERSLNL